MLVVYAQTAYRKIGLLKSSFQWLSIYFLCCLLLEIGWLSGILCKYGSYVAAGHVICRLHSKFFF